MPWDAGGLYASVRPDKIFDVREVQDVHVRICLSNEAPRYDRVRSSFHHVDHLCSFFVFCQMDLARMERDVAHFVCFGTIRAHYSG